jgi:hypothetical protein
MAWYGGREGRDSGDGGESAVMAMSGANREQCQRNAGGSLGAPPKEVRSKPPVDFVSTHIQHKT